MDEMSAEELRELEEQLYSQVHHDVNSVTFSGSTRNNEMERPEKRTNRFLSNRYWTNNIDKNHYKRTEGNAFSMTVPKSQKFRNPLAKFKNPFAKQKSSNTKQRIPQRHDQSGPFAMKGRRLEREVRFREKKQKSNNARNASNQKPRDTIVLDSDNCNDSDEEVVHVPLPPTPIYTVDDSDEEINKKGSTETIRVAAKDTKSDENSEKRQVVNENTSRCNSPNSVMSQDDFIGQTDCHRLTEKTTIADDEDLINLTSNADSLMEPPSPPKILDLLQAHEASNKNKDSSDEIECLGTFIKPNAMMTSNEKNNYRVDQGGFRAMDVYESESDIVSDGVYSKAASKSVPPTPVIRNIDNSSGEEVEDISVSQAKMKRLRKRRASGSMKGSESNGGGDSSDEIENDGVAETAVPYISRGPAVETFKSKKFRKRTISTSGQMSDSKFMATLNSLAQGSNNTDATVNEEMDEGSEAGEEQEEVPSARDIAEKVLNQQRDVTSSGGGSEEPSTSSGKKRKNNDAIPEKIADNIEEIFDKINKLAERKAIELSDEDICNATTGMHFETTNDNSEASIEINEETMAENVNETPINEIKYFIGYTQANRCISDGLVWNEEMRRFYNCSWGGENFREDDILRKMNRDRRLWAIKDVDRYPNIRRDRREKCINCLSFGHVRARCPKPKKPLVCYMCGEKGHLESRCPNTRCLRCGSKTSMYCQSCRKCMYWNNRICPICKLRGHSLNDCPDKWRRYHSTTQPNKHPNSHIDYNRKRFCCYCGKRRHLSDVCYKALRCSEYPIISNEIHSHEKSYDDVIINPYKTPDIPCNLLADPNEDFDLKLAEDATPTKVYGRFLVSVGLEKLIGKKAKRNENETTMNTNDQKSKENSAPNNMESPEQVPEVSESHSGSNEDSNTASQVERLQMPPPRAPELIEPSMELDSDSNYSFSDHFEPQPNQNAVSTPFPDFIPLGSNSSEDSRLEEMPSTLKTGISAQFFEPFSDDDEEQISQVDAPSSSNIDTPCEAKIYISDDHNKYFQSKLGQEYLAKIMSDNKLTGRLNKTIAGYALFIHGMPGDQENLQRELETKFKSLNDQKVQQCETSSKVPKHVDVLIRFLRDSINQLFTNLGNVADLYKRLMELEKNTSKNSLKSADRVRRTLNMIFLGQAGLSNGDNYFNTLLKGLTTLINDHNGSDKTPNKLREEIDSNWRKLFTSYNHKNYAQLCLSYLKLPSTMKNRLPQLKIEPSLLGLSTLDVTMNNEQIARLNKETNTSDVSTINKEINLILNVMSTEQNQEQSSKIIEENSLPKQKQLSQAKVNNETLTKVNNNSNNLNKQTINNQDKTTMQSNIPVTTKSSSFPKKSQLFTLKKKSNVQITGNQSKISKIVSHQPPAMKTLPMPSPVYDNLLLNISSGANTGNLKGDGKSPSCFWSYQSKLVIESLLKSPHNPIIMERLERIHKKAVNGELSYNDHQGITRFSKSTENPK